MKLLVFFILMCSSLVFANDDVTSTPMAYAENVTQKYVENTSDMEPYGLDECNYTTDEGADNPQIECTGTKTVLVWGGYESSGQVTCNYSFQKIDKTTYKVVQGTESCQ